MSLTESIKTCFQKYAQFQGRASRAEYWWFVLFQIVVGIGFIIVAGLMGLSEDAINGMSGLFSLALFLPTIAVAARRLHDLNMTGWWQLISITVIGVIPYLYWLCKAGDSQANRFGPAAA